VSDGEHGRARSSTRSLICKTFYELKGTTPGTPEFRAGIGRIVLLWLAARPAAAVLLSQPLAVFAFS
jgi:hypothetical protein